MPRTYTMSEKAKAARVKNAAAARAAQHSPGGLITRIERAKKNLTPEHIARLSALLASATASTNADPEND